MKSKFRITSPLKIIAPMFLLMTFTSGVHSQQSAPMTWYKDKALPEDFVNAREKCLGKTDGSPAQANACLISEGFRLVEKSRIDYDRQTCDTEARKTGNPDGALFFSCMLSKGWDLKTRLNEENEKFSIELDRLCSDPEMKEFFLKTPCRPMNFTVEQLSDGSKLTDSQKKLLLRFSKIQHDQRLVAANSVRSFGSSRDKQMQTNRELNYYPANDDNIVGLINKKITWGEFNKRRRDLQLQNRNENQKIINADNERIRDRLATLKQQYAEKYELRREKAASAEASNAQARRETQCQSLRRMLAQRLDEYNSFANAMGDAAAWWSTSPGGPSAALAMRSQQRNEAMGQIQALQQQIISLCGSL